MKYTAILCMLLASYAFWQHFSLRQIEEKNQQLRMQNKILQQNQDNLIKKIGEFNAKQQYAGRQIAKLKYQAQQNKDDCYHKPISGAYLNIVRGTKSNGF